MASVALQSKDHRDLLDIIDSLRSKGISRYVDLPQIVVCGDQSAGKSSVLEAISGMTFPTKDNLCTRFATELILRRHVTHAVKVSINPGPDRSADERERLSQFSLEVDHSTLDVGNVVEKAKEAMGLSETKVFSSDILRVELCGPSQPHLTMVDLPGLFRAGNRDQSVQDAAIVRKMVRGYVKRPRSIVLAVVSAKSDFALQEITEMARELDPKGIRTLGLITKPDALDVGSDSEAAYAKLARNKDVVFRLGWHVLKNRDFKMRDATSAERDEAEAEFFSKGIWTTLDPSHLGVESLKPRLSNVLKDQILQQLPELLCDVDTEIAACKIQLQRLGTPRTTLTEQRKYLLQVSRDFTMLIKAAVDGEYNNAFFESARSDEGYRKRLRARVQNTLADFEKRMRAHGQFRTILEDSDKEVPPCWENKISRSNYIDEVKVLMSRNRGRELPGTFNPLIISELFAEQCQPWSQLAVDVEKDILQVVYDVVRAIVDHVVVKETANSIFNMIHSGIDDLTKELSGKFKELLRPHLEGHPITYNHYLTDTVQKVQADRRRRQLEKELKSIVGAQAFENGGPVYITPMDVLNRLDKRTEVNMERFGSELATDYMQAYYKLALKKFVDDVGVLAVEQCLISKLPHLFHAEAVLDLEDNEVHRLAGENENSSLERERCREKLEILESGQKELKRLGSRQPLNMDTMTEPSSESESGAEALTDVSEVPGEASVETEPLSDPDLDGTAAPDKVQKEEPVRKSAKDSWLDSSLKRDKKALKKQKKKTSSYVGPVEESEDKPKEPVTPFAFNDGTDYSFKWHQV